MIVSQMRPRTKPPIGAPLNYGNPFARGLVGAFLFNEGAGSRSYNAVDRRMALSGSALPVWASSRDGAVLQFNGTSQTIGNVDQRWNQATDFTFIARWSLVALPSAYKTIAYVLSSTAPTGQSVYRCFGLGVTDSNVPRSTVHIGGDVEDAMAAVSAAVANQVYTSVLTRNGSVSRFFLDGIFQATTTRAGSVNTFSDTMLAVAALGNTGFEYNNVRISHVYVYNRGMTDSEAAEITANPFTIFDPPQRYWVFPTAGGGLPFFMQTDLKAGQTQALTGNMQ